MTLEELDLPFICHMGMRQRGRLLQVLLRESQSWRSCWRHSVNTMQMRVTWVCILSSDSHGIPKAAVKGLG